MYKQASIPRNELLAWINDILCTNYIKLEDASNGAVACQIIDLIHPGTVPMKNLNFSASTPYECQKNYRILRKAFEKLSIPIDFDINILSKQGSKEGYEFLATLKSYYDANYKSSSYDPVARRSESKGTIKVTRADTYTPHTPRGTHPAPLFDSPSRVISARTTASPRKVYPPVTPQYRATFPRDHVSPRREGGGSVQSLPSPELVKQNESLRQQCSWLQSQCHDLQEQLQELHKLHDYREMLLAEERVFYYNKLRNIEDLLQGIQVNRHLTDVENSILQILYSREGMEFLLKAIEENREDSEGEQRVESMNSDDRVSDEIM